MKNYKTAPAGREIVAQGKTPGVAALGYGHIIIIFSPSAMFALRQFFPSLHLSLSFRVFRLFHGNSAPEGLSAQQPGRPRYHP